MLNRSIRHALALLVEVGGANHLPLNAVPQKVVMSIRMVVEKVHEELLIASETACDEGIGENLVGHCVVVQSEHLIDLNLLQLHLLLIPLL